MKTNPSNQTKWVLTYLRPVFWKLMFLMLLLLITNGLSIWNPVIMQNFIDVATHHGTLHDLVMLAGLFLTIAIVNQLISVFMTYLGTDVAWLSTNLLRSDLLRHCLRLDLQFHNERTPGEMIERIDGDVSTLSNFFSQFMVKILGSVLLLAGILVVMFRLDWWAGMTMLGFTLVSVIILFTIRNIGVSASIAERQTSAQLFGLIEERLSGIEDVQANGATGYVMRRFHRSMREFFRTGRKAWMLRVVPFNVTNALYTMAVVAILGIGVALYLKGHLSLGTLYLFYQYTFMLNDPLEQLGNQIQDYQRAKSSLKRIQGLFSVESGVADGSGGTLPVGPLSIEFRDVTFGYTEDTSVLHSVQFRLEAGEVLGIVGRTGSGKTSLSRLLLRLYNTTGGIVLLGGVDIRDVPLKQLYQRVGMVTQDVQLFDATIRDNLTLFDTDISDAEVQEMMARLGLTEWLNQLPNGLDAHLSAGGSSLSAGEAQLIALARVFLTKPSLVILDEPSSRLDPATESMLQQAVDQLLQESTGIVIAHRLSTLERVDKIMVLRDGHILEFGDRTELVQNASSHFAGLLQSELQEELV